jgi:hypothetical protein
LAGLILFIPLVCTLIGFLAGFLGAFILLGLRVITDGQGVLLCLYFTGSWFVLGIIVTARKFGERSKYSEIATALRLKKYDCGGARA